jgi:hypothetical protein
MTFQVLSGTNVLTNVVVGINQNFEHLFDSAGNYVVNGSFSNDTVSTNKMISVAVVSASFPLAETVCVAGMARAITCPSLSTNNVVIDSDSALEVVVSPSGAGTSLQILNRYDTPLYILARLGEDGPILDSTKVSTVYGDNGSYWQVVENYPDGSRLVRVKLQLGCVPTDIQVKLHIFLGGATFDDGTLNKTLTAADFDGMGVATYYMVQSAGITSSTCHTTIIYQGQTIIGSN